VRRLALFLAVGLAGCTGTITDDGSATPGGKKPPVNTQTGAGGSGGSGTGGAGGSGGTTMTDPMMPPSAQVTCAGDGKEIIGKRALRRLTIPEFEATIRATFGLDSKQWAGLTVPPDAGSEDGFTNNVDRLTVSPEYARGASESSRAIASVVSSDAMLTRLLPCAATGGAACADSFVTSFGSKLYRRPLAPAEKARYLALHDKVAKAGDFKTFVYWATSTMLQSPHVIYRSELGEPDGKRFKLTPYEVASQLSYTFTGGPPSPELMQLAASNQLSTPDQVEAAAKALVFDGANVRPAFREIVQRFADQWLGLSKLSNLKKDTMLYPDFNTKIQDALAEETRRFISAVILEDRGTITDLLTAPYTFVDPTLAKYYGFGAATGTDFVRVNRPPTWGVGLLAQGSMLSVAANSLTTSPTRRGHMIREHMMCVVVPPPPPVVDPVPEPTATNTTRQRYEEQHANVPACKDCHAMMDPIGFAFEHLDAAGRFRQKEGQFEIDDSGVIIASSKGDLRVQGPTELAKALAGLPEVTDCMASYVAAYALGVNHDSAACLISSATDELRKGMSIVDFYVRMSRSEHFRFRQ
jgi:hypothetical protein